MPDPARELRRDVRTLVQRIQEGWQAAIGIDLPLSSRLRGTAPSSFNETSPDAFATGYDGSETTMVFTFDFSHFDGADPLA